MRLGFLQVRQTGSHVVFLHEDGRRVVVPRHDREDIGVGLVRQILKQADIPLDRFLDEV